MTQLAATKSMGKTQKTMMVPEDLYKLIDSRESLQGATFTRQAIASFFSYFFSMPSPWGPESLWMQAVIAVENGTLSVGDVPIWYCTQKLAECGEQIQKLRDFIKENPDDSFAKDQLDYYLSRERYKWEKQLQQWENIQRLGGNTIDGTIRHWNGERLKLHRIFIPLNPDGTTDHKPGDKLESEDYYV